MRKSVLPFLIYIYFIMLHNNDVYLETKYTCNCDMLYISVLTDFSCTCVLYITI